MRVIVYRNIDDQAPPGAAFIARIRCDFPAYKQGKRVAGMAEDWHPVIVYGITADAAREAAQNWWDGELAKERAKEDQRTKQGERMRELAAARRAQSATDLDRAIKAASDDEIEAMIERDGKR